MQGAGRDGIEVLVTSVQVKFPGFCFTRDGSAGVVQGTIRFHWTLGPEDQALVEGADFIRIEGDRIQTVTGFVNQMPDIGGAG